MNTIKNSWLLLALSICGILQSQAQLAPYTEVNITSPTAAALGKFTDVPVNYHTGIPQISISICTIKEGTLTLPISLSYHAAGVKVMEPASWVGTGWSLQAGGVISRTVKGAPDEGGTTGIGVYGHFSHFGFSNYLTNGGGSWSQSTHGTVPADSKFASGELDGEPDLFFFNFNGYSGKFYFNDDRTPVFVDGDDLKVDYFFPRDTASSYNALTANIQGFIITTPNGDKYHFGKTPGGSIGGADAIELSFPYSSQQTNTSDRVISSWYLTKIASFDGIFSINFTYTAEVYSYYMLSMFPIDGTWIPGLNNWSNSEYSLVKNYIEGVRLSQVSFSNGVINFTPASTARTDLGNNYTNANDFTDNANTEAKALASILISNNNGFCKQFKFYYSYFSNDEHATSLQGYLSNYTIQTDKTRLKLDSVLERSCDSSVLLKPYKFQYYSTFLPRRLSFAQDHWGFYNGETSNNTLIPTYTIDTFKFVSGATRDAKWPDMKEGALTKIFYPTGGSTTFEYEPNTTWISTTRYSSVFRYSYTVGFDGNSNATFNNVSFSGNYYRVILSNGSCPPNTPGCAAGVNIINNSSTVIKTLGANGNQSDTAYLVIPSGNYTITLSRAATQTGTGATATFTEIIPSFVEKNDTVGGLRIKTITQRDSVSAQHNIVTSYTYNESNGHSSGMLYSRPRYVQVLRNSLVAQFGLSPQTSNLATNLTPNGCMGPETGGNSQLYFKSPSPIVPMATTQGNHIGYNEVKIIQNGNGYSIFRYYGSNIWDNLNDDVCYRNVNPKTCSSLIPSSPAAPLAFEYKRGQLKYEGHFNQSDQLLKEVHYFYDFDSTVLTTPGYIVKSLLTALLGNQYELRGYWKKKIQTVSNDYVPGDTSLSITNTTYFESPYHHQPTRQEVLNSVNDTLISKTKYAQDFRISNCDTISTGLASYTAACTFCNDTLTTTNSGCSNLTCGYWAWSDNLMCRAIKRANLITLRRSNFTNTSNAFATCMASAKSAASLPFKQVLELKDVFINAPIELTSWKNSKLLSAGFTSFEYSANPSAKVYPNKTQLLQVLAPSNTFTVAGNSSTALTKDSRYKDESTVRFLLGNLVNITTKNGVPVSYLWDYGNTLPVAKVLGAIDTAIAYTSFEAAGSGNWTIGSTQRITTDSLTGHKCYQLSNGNITRSNLQPTVMYTLSYWTKNSSALTVSGSLDGTVLIKSVNGWNCFVHRIYNVSQVTLSGTALLDELRLYPENAQLISYTYDPLVGITTECDIANRITYYQYDRLGRLQLIRDQDKNIIKTFNYTYQEQQ